MSIDLLRFFGAGLIDFGVFGVLRGRVEVGVGGLVVVVWLSPRRGVFEGREGRVGVGEWDWGW